MDPELFRKYLQKTATPEERAAFFSQLDSADMEELSKLQEDIDIPDELFTQLTASSSDRILRRILPAKRLYWWRMAAAAAVLLAVVGGLYHYTGINPPRAQLVSKLHDKQPGHTGAILTLSNGSTIVLDSVQNGLLTNGFTKTSDALQVDEATPLFATLSTPAGRQQKLVLGDGTIAFLNAGSSISFRQGSREVSITGEVYFDVAPDATHPFIVRAGGDEIKVLGTRFNVNAYADEPTVSTTLIDGKIQLNNQYLLQPGDQYHEGQIRKTDTDAAIAWMSGFFHFENDDIVTVMRQLARWYNLTVTYDGKIPTLRFYGEIQRNLMLSEVLELLGGSGIDYTLDGDRLIIRAH